MTTFYRKVLYNNGAYKMTIPIELIRELQIKEGDVLELETLGKTLMIKKKNP